MSTLLAADIESVVAKHVNSVEAIDVHTHLLPPSHGELLLHGLDELLTYHYLIAELFMILPLASEEDMASTAAIPSDPDAFFAWSKQAQADLVFEELFVKRTPLSEACRGVVTSLKLLGLGELLVAAARPETPAPRLASLRAAFRQRTAAEQLEAVFVSAKLKYAVMTNIPFAPEEATHFMPSASGAPPPPFTPRLKTALRVDPLLVGDWPAVCVALQRTSPPYELSLDGCKAYLRDWVRRIQPLYLMASTPAGFQYVPSASASSQPSSAQKRDVDGAPVQARDERSSSSSSGGGGGGGSNGAAAPSATDVLERALLAVAVEEKLPIALKIGALRGANPALRTGGDGVEVADLAFVYRLCRTYPHVKFLLTVLAAANQHELCVLARKFGNLHVYGCWWFCNNPSIIEDTTRMRLEMLGTAFTCQHSDARVLEQLLYKWSHSRAVVAPVLAEMYRRLHGAGWEVTEEAIARDVGLLFGGAFEAFMAK